MKPGSECLMLVEGGMGRMGTWRDQGGALCGLWSFSGRWW